MSKYVLEGSVNIGLTAFLYCYYQAWKNRGEQKKLDEEREENRDNTRPQTPSFGLSWGAKADLMIMDEIDTGDLLFASNNCSKLTSALGMMKCYTHSVLGLRPKFDEVGVAVRYPNELLVLSNSLNKISVEEYPKYVAKIYKAQIIARKIVVPSSDTEKELYLKAKGLVESENELEKVNSDELPKLIISKLGLASNSEGNLTADDLFNLTRANKTSDFAFEKEIIIRNN